MRILFFSMVMIGLASEASAGDAVQGKPLKEWKASLRHKDPNVRYKAVEALYEAGAEGAPLVGELAQLLKDPQPAIRRAAAQALGGLKEEAAPAAVALLAALREPDPALRHWAFQALREMGEAASPQLLKLIEDKDAAVRQQAILTIHALELQGKDIAKALGKATKDANPTVKRMALFALVKIDADNPEIYAILGAALHDKEQNVRASANSILMGMGKEANETFAKVADDPRAAARLLAIQALASRGDDLDEKGGVALRKGLADSDPRIRLTAVQGLANIGTRAREWGEEGETFVMIAKLMNDKSVQIRRTAVLALGKLGSDDANEITKLATAFKDSDALVRLLAAQALASYATEKLGQDARERLHGHLIEAMGDADRRVQFTAAQAFTAEMERAVAPLMRVVEKEKGTRRIWAAIVLGELGATAEDAVPALQKMIQDGTPEARTTAQAALKKIQQ